MIKIWGRSTSLNVQKVLWCCVELGIAFQRIDWGGPFGGNDDPAYLEMNPNGRVPTIEDGDKIVWESNTILRYLCAVHGGARLHPPDAYRRSEVERWMDWPFAAGRSWSGSWRAESISQAETSPWPISATASWRIAGTTIRSSGRSVPVSRPCIRH
jgi:glutathione S-transferase